MILSMMTHFYTWHGYFQN